MYSNKARLLSIENLRILAKVCSRPPSNSSNYAKPFGCFLRNLSAAAEKSDFVHNFNDFDGVNYVQAPSSLQKPDSFCNGNVNATAQTGSFSPASVEYEHRNEFRQNPNGQNENHNSCRNSSNVWESARGLQNSSGSDVVNNRGESAYMQQQQQQRSWNVMSHDRNVNEGVDRNLSGYFNGNYTPQQNVGNYSLEDRPSVPMYHASGALNVQYGQGNYYAGNNTQGYQQHTSGTNYMWNSNELQNATVDPQVPPQDEDDGSMKGTIEELDRFYKEGKLKEAVECLALLEQRHVAVDLPRLLSLMKLCAEYKALDEAKSVHKHLVRSGIHLEVKIYNKVIEMYCKCGSMDDAFEVFNQMQKRNLTSWDLMITWFGRNGQGEDALELFTQFKESGWKPDPKIFLGVFSACGEVGDIIEGMLQFESMSKDYGIVPSMEHYVSVVSMMGSVGYLDEALEFIERMPIEPNVDVWKTLMNFCRIHGNSELGDRCTDIIDMLEPSCLDVQSRAGLIPVISSDLTVERKIQKSASQGIPEARSRVHEYRAGDRSCPENEKLYALLRGLKQQMKEAGYMPELKFVLHDIDPEAKEEAIMAHSEKLAVARGLIDSPARSVMRIIKNLRICGDCHSSMKIISKLVGRVLIIRDAKRFHHFRDGSCSCHDYW